MADPLSIGAALLAVGALAERLHARLTAQPPAPPPSPSPTILPPAPSQPSVHDAELAAVAARVAGLELREEKARDAREAMGNTLTKILTILEERAAQRAAKEKSRGSES